MWHQEPGYRRLDLERYDPWAPPASERDAMPSDARPTDHRLDPTEVASGLAAEVEDALVDGDRSVDRGTARAAFAYPVFRRVYLGSLLSNVGTWMQNVTLGAYVYEQTGSSSQVAFITFAQLGPLLVFSLVGGAIADRFNRRTVLVVVSVEQALFSLAIAQLTRDADPSMTLLMGAVLLIGVGQAVYAPTYSALIPTLVERSDLSGAISLNSASMNLSRVVGPAIGGVLFSRVGAPWVFAGNAATYLFIIGALWGLTLPRPAPVDVGESRIQRVIGGVRVAREDGIVGRCLITMVAFSFFCLPIVVLLPVLAHDNLGIDERSAAYGFLYAAFGAGAVVGALSIGTFLAGRNLAKVVRAGLVAFGVTLATLALLRVAPLAFPVIFAVGCAYFATVTSLATVLQQRLDDAVRGRVMALWIMAFGGTVPVGAVVAGPASDAIGITPVVLAGAVVSVLLASYANLRPRDRARRESPSHC